MKWLRIGLLIALLLLLIPLPLIADSTAEVTITAVGYIVGAPGAFTVTYISDYEIGLSWAMGAGANNTMVRAAYGRYPASRTDGYLVYYGNSTYATDWVNLETTDTRLYYRAWSETVAGVWEEEGSTGWTEGVSMKLIAMIVLCMGLIAIAYWRRNTVLFMLAMLAWIGFAFWNRSLTPAWGTWDLNEILFYVGFLAAIFCLIQGVIINREEQEEEPRPPKVEPAEEYWARYNRMMAGVRTMSTRIRRR